MAERDSITWTEGLPAPGHHEAVKQGCTCNVYENNQGKGFGVKPDGAPFYKVAENCPLHGMTDD